MKTKAKDGKDRELKGNPRCADETDTKSGEIGESLRTGW